jgi:hypothetical protein
MNLNKLFAIHAFITLAAALVLICAPSVIPHTVNIQMGPGQFLLCYFLAAAELALAYLSFYSRNITDKAALRHVVITMIIFHGMTLLLEVFALSRGISPKILVNILARVVIIALFYFYGILKTAQVETSSGPV